VLKTRIIPTLLCRGRELVKGERFNSWRRVGNTMQAAKVHSARGVDELAILSIEGLMSSKMVTALCAGTFMPVMIGGGIKSLDDMEMLFRSGADKVCINTAAWKAPQLITDAAAKYGSQSVCVSIDSKDGRVQIDNGKVNVERDVVSWAHQAVSLGAGEILLNDVERDGTMNGYNMELISLVTKAVRVPVIAAGGCGKYSHMQEVLDETEASAVASGSMFIFTDRTPKGAAKFLRSKGFATRVE
jgi:cyclase